MKILLLKPSSLGDVVHALPVLRLLKRQLPHSEIYWWIEASLAPFLEGDPDLAGVIRFERRRWARPKNWLGLLRSVRWIRQKQFDWVIDLQCLARSGAFAWLARGGLCVGLDTHREGARGFYDVAVPRPAFHTHAVDWYLAVLPRLGVPLHSDFQWLPERPAVAAAVRQKWPVAGKHWVVLQPGARWATKRWPAQYYAELVQRLAARRPDLHFAILGAPEDRPLGGDISAVDRQRCLDLTGRLTLLELVEWIRLSKLMVTNDTGPMHIAAALGKPLVALFGPTEPCRTGPYGQLQHVLQLDLPCVPCLRSRCAHCRPLECLRALPPGAVAQAVLNRFTACYPEPSL